MLLMMLIGRGTRCRLPEMFALRVLGLAATWMTLTFIRDARCSAIPWHSAFAARIRERGGKKCGR
jgi:hypothetical protein